MLFQVWVVFSFKRYADSDHASRCGWYWKNGQHGLDCGVSTVMWMDRCQKTTGGRFRRSTWKELIVVLLRRRLGVRNVRESVVSTPVSLPNMEAFLRASQRAGFQIIHRNKDSNSWPWRSWGEKASFFIHRCKSMVTVKRNITEFWNFDFKKHGIQRGPPNNRVLMSISWTQPKQREMVIAVVRRERRNNMSSSYRINGIDEPMTLFALPKCGRFLIYRDCRSISMIEAYMRLLQFRCRWNPHCQVDLLSTHSGQKRCQKNWGWSSLWPCSTCRKIFGSSDAWHRNRARTRPQWQRTGVSAISVYFVLVVVIVNRHAGMNNWWVNQSTLLNGCNNTYRSCIHQ